MRGILHCWLWRKGRGAIRQWQSSSTNRAGPQIIAPSETHTSITRNWILPITSRGRLSLADALISDLEWVNSDQDQNLEPIMLCLDSLIYQYYFRYKICDNLLRRNTKLIYAIDNITYSQAKKLFLGANENIKG